MNASPASNLTGVSSCADACVKVARSGGGRERERERERDRQRERERERERERARQRESARAREREREIREKCCQHFCNCLK